MLEAHELENNDSSFDYSKISDKETNRLLASLVVDWSFKNDDGTEYKCNEKNIIELLEQAPVLAQEIDEVSSKRRNFIKRSLSQSENIALEQFKFQKKPEKSKISKIEHLKQVWKTTGIKPKELEFKKHLPDRLTYLLGYYQEIKTSDPITYEEINCWSKITGITPTPFEAEAIRAIDQQYLTILNNND